MGPWRASRELSHRTNLSRYLVLPPLLDPPAIHFPLFAVCPLPSPIPQIPLPFRVVDNGIQDGLE